MPPKRRSSSRSPARSPARASNASDSAANRSAAAAPRQRSGSRGSRGSPARGGEAAAAAPGEAPPAEVRGYDVAVHFKAVSGNYMASIMAVSDWTGAQVLKALEDKKPLLPGHEYKMIFGDAEFTADQKISSLSEKIDEPAEKISELTMTAMVQRKESFQMDMDLALIKAAGALNLDLVKELLSAGASAKFVHDPEGTWGAQDRKSALHMAIQGLPYRDPEPAVVESWKAVIATLLEANADVNARRSSSDWRGCGSSSTAFEMILPKAMSDAKLLQVFLEAGANPNTESRREVHSMRTDGSTKHAVIHTATQAGNHQVIRTLLDAKADANSTATERMNNERGYDRDTSETSLHIACKKGDVKGAALLLAHRADVNTERRELLQEEKTREEMMAEMPDMPVKSKKGGKVKSKKATSMTDDPREDGYVSPVRCISLKETALHIAIKSKNVALTTLLMCAGADASAEYVHGDTVKQPEGLCSGDATLLAALASPGSLPSGSEVSSDKAASMMYKILKVFREWDKNADGFIEMDELTKVLKDLGVPEDSIPSIFTGADWDRDGKISYSEFVDWLYSDIPSAALIDSELGHWLDPVAVATKDE
mmetsp:Transcript_16666/g.31002  ORF Transcript_16666/g.31002 Transcript_16666/m.31002 type:complete len:598 (-) Transcript_16666:199-1992(-)